MTKIAQVIVDVPLMQTDKPFSYLVPEDMQNQVMLGSRVHVPLVTAIVFAGICCRLF